MNLLLSTNSSVNRYDYALYNASRKTVANWPTISGPTTLDFPNPIKKREKNERLVVIMRNSRQKKWKV
jgi:hypothetical protein